MISGLYFTTPQLLWAIPIALVLGIIYIRRTDKKLFWGKQTCDLLFDHCGRG